MNNWHLNPEEVRSYEGGDIYNISLRTGHRHPRAINPNSIELYLVHDPTNIEVSGIIPEGNHSHQELQLLRQSLYDSLFLELERRVGEFLKASEQ